MSKRTGDRANFNREHKKRMRRRKRDQDLRQTLEAKTSGLEAPSPVEVREQIATSRLRQLPRELKTGSAAFEIVVYKIPQGEQND